MTGCFVFVQLIPVCLTMFSSLLCASSLVFVKPICIFYSTTDWNFRSSLPVLPTRSYLGIGSFSTYLANMREAVSEIPSGPDSPQLYICATFLGFLGHSIMDWRLIDWFPDDWLIVDGRSQALSISILYSPWLTSDPNGAISGPDGPCPKSMESLVFGVTVGLRTSHWGYINTTMICY